MPRRITPPRPPEFTISPAERDALASFITSTGNLSNAQLSQAARMISRFILAIYDVQEFERKSGKR
jgi:hypothetical protein